MPKIFEVNATCSIPEEQTKCMFLIFSFSMVHQQRERNVSGLFFLFIRFVITLSHFEDTLTKIIGKNCVLFNSIQEFIEIEAWLRLNCTMFYTSHCHILKCMDVWNSWFIKQTENERLFLSTNFTAKFELLLVLTLENTFSQRFHLKVNRKGIGSSKKRYSGFSK